MLNISNVDSYLIGSLCINFFRLFEFLSQDTSMNVSTADALLAEKKDTFTFKKDEEERSRYVG